MEPEIFYEEGELVTNCRQLVLPLGGRCQLLQGYGSVDSLFTSAIDVQKKIRERYG
jgi:hypothetical protein